MRGPYEYEMPGHNYRLTDVQAALGLPQMRRLPELIAKRRQHAARLSDGLRDIDGLLLPVIRNRAGHAFDQFTVRVTSDARCGRDELFRALLAAGIHSAIHYPKPLHTYECYRTIHVCV